VPWTIEPLDKSHDGQGFACGEPQLDDYLKKYALQSGATGLGRTFVALEPGTKVVRGYFTLAAGTVKFDTIPDHAKRRLPRYPIPTAHLAKLAVDSSQQGRGLGAALLVEALIRAARAGEHVGVFAVDVLALNERARSFYVKYGFVALADNQFHLYMSIKTAQAVVKLAQGGPPA
jgi:ribosomal protein S18 acetylase RimI-like enzyme